MSDRLETLKVLAPVAVVFFGITLAVPNIFDHSPITIGLFLLTIVGLFFVVRFGRSGSTSLLFGVWPCGLLWVLGAALSVFLTERMLAGISANPVDIALVFAIGTAEVLTPWMLGTWLCGTLLFGLTAQLIVSALVGWHQKTQRVPLLIDAAFVFVCALAAISASFSIRALQVGLLAFDAPDSGTRAEQLRMALTDLATTDRLATYVPTLFLVVLLFKIWARFSKRFDRRAILSVLLLVVGAYCFNLVCTVHFRRTTRMADVGVKIPFWRWSLPSPPLSQVEHLRPVVSSFGKRYGAPNLLLVPRAVIYHYERIELAKTGEVSALLAALQERPVVALDERLSQGELTLFLEAARSAFLESVVLLSTGLDDSLRERLASRFLLDGLSQTASTGVRVWLGSAVSRAVAEADPTLFHGTLTSSKKLVLGTRNGSTTSSVTIDLSRSGTSKPEGPLVYLTLGDANAQQVFDACHVLSTHGYRPLLLAHELPDDPNRPLGTVKVGMGAVKIADVREVFQRNHKKVRQCYEEVRGDAPLLQGHVVLELVLRPSGILRIDVVESSIRKKPDQLFSCIRTVLMKAKFPKPLGGGTVRVRYPFRFRPR